MATASASPKEDSGDVAEMTLLWCLPHTISHWVGFSGQLLLKEDPVSISQCHHTKDTLLVLATHSAITANALFHNNRKFQP